MFLPRRLVAALAVAVVAAALAVAVVAVAVVVWAAFRLIGSSPVAAAGTETTERSEQVEATREAYAAASLRQQLATARDRPVSTPSACGS